MKIFLTDLQNSHFRMVRNYVPIGMGYVGAYINKFFSSEVELQLFRKFEDMHKALQENTPDIVAFGSYDWNTSLTLKSVNYIKQNYPDIIIAVGGPNVSPEVAIAEAELRENPAIDFFLPNEGEGPMRNLVQACLEEKQPQNIRGKAVKGCLSIDPESQKLLGVPIERFEGDINEIPSPYLTGLMDQFIKDPIYLPIIQTSRGCPYRCTFCVSGKDTWIKIRTFNLDRVQAELDYLQKNSPISFLRLADENFGILQRDVEVAKMLIEKHETEGYPNGLSMYTDKRPTKRIQEIQLMLKNLLPFNISFQSMNPDTLKKVQRINLKDNMLRTAVEFARANELPLVTEMIAALPGETFDSFLNGVDTLMDYGFESIIVSQLRILKGTKQDWASERQKYKMKTCFSMAENGFTDHPDLTNVELEEWVIETDSLSEDEYYTLNKFIFLLDFFHGRRFMLHIIFHFHNHKIKLSKLLMAVLENRETCPLLCSKADIFIERMQKLFHPTPEAAVATAKQDLKANPEMMTGLYKIEEGLMIDILSTGQINLVIEELANMGRRLYYRQGPTEAAKLEFEATLQTVCELTKNVFIPLDQPSPEVTCFDSEFDVAAWIHHKYSNPLSFYKNNKPVRSFLKIRQIDPYMRIWNSSMSIKERSIRHLDTINSSNRTRLVLAKGD